MMTDTAKIKTEMVRVLEICRDVELANAKLYNYFAEIFSNHQEMADLWRKTVKEEENHAKQFTLAIHLRREQLVDSLAIDATAAKKMLSNVESLCDGVKKNKPSMDEALKIAIQLEEDLATFHMTTVVNFTEESQKKLFVAMMKSDKNHIEDLRKFQRGLTV